MKFTLLCTGLVAVPSAFAYLDFRSSVLTLATLLGPAPVAAYAVPNIAHMFVHKQHKRQDNTTDPATEHHLHNGTHECHSNTTAAFIDAALANGTAFNSTGCHHHHHHNATSGTGDATRGNGTTSNFGHHFRNDTTGGLSTITPFNGTEHHHHRNSTVTDGG